MIGVLVTDKDGNVQKRVYAGDTAKARMDIGFQAQEDPSSVFEIHEESDADWKTAFLSKKETIIPVKPQTDWQAAKAGGTDSAIAFLAKRMGLE